jgi:hypothetical protein
VAGDVVIQLALVGQPFVVGPLGSDLVIVFVDTPVGVLVLGRPSSYDTFSEDPHLNHLLSGAGRRWSDVYHAA